MSSSDLRSNAVLDSLREREEFLRRILASSEDCIKILTLEARLEYMSENGRKALAIPDFELVRDADWLAFWHGDDRRAAEAAVSAARSGVKRSCSTSGTMRSRARSTSARSSPSRSSRPATPSAR